MTTVQVLPTTYRGVQFRSRTEARWAVFFDVLLLPWEYEKEGYALPSGNYLPDFWLDGIGWFEVKGKRPNDRERAVAFDLAMATNVPVFIAYHNHSAPLDIDGVANGWDSDSIEAFFPFPSWDNRYAFCVCEPCLAENRLNVGLQFEARSERQCADHGPGRSKCYTGRHRLIRNAYEKARTYRFWNP